MIKEIDGYTVKYKQEKTTKRWRVWIIIEGKKVYLHRYIANKYIRPITSNDLIHHKDGNPLNNDINNLQIVTRAEHSRIHKPCLGYIFTDEQKKKLSEAHKGNKLSEETKEKLRNKVVTDETRLKLSKAFKGRKITWGDKISKAKYKITKEQVLDYLKENPMATIKDIMIRFELKTHMAIYRLGGLKNLRKESRLDYK